MLRSSLTEFDQQELGYSFGNFRLEADGTLFRGTEQVHLPPKELSALRFLLAHNGHVVTPGQLKVALWGEVNVTADSVPRCMSSLRTRLEPDHCIQTVYKRGYRMATSARKLGKYNSLQTRVAIMPFSGSSFVPDYLGPMIAEEVSARLTAGDNEAVSILARDSVFTLARRGLSAVQVGETLKADLVLAGTLTATPLQYRLRVEMIRVEDGTQIWVEDLLVAKHEVSKLNSRIVNRVLHRLGSRESDTATEDERAPNKATIRDDAYDVFLRGRHEWRTLERHRMQDGMMHLIRATELDPSFISAQVDLANVCITQELYGFMAPDIAAEQVNCIGESIPDVSETAPAMLLNLAWVKFHVDRNLSAANEMFSLSEHLPHDSWTTRMRVMFALSRQRFDEAFAILESALLIDPYAADLYSRLAWTHHLAGNKKESVAQIEKSVALFPEHQPTQLGAALILAYNGHTKRALSISQSCVRRIPYFDIATAIHAYVLACDGQREEAVTTLEELEWRGRERYVLNSFSPAAYAVLGDLDSAITQLRIGSEVRCPWFFQMLADPRLAPLHGHPEFQEMCGILNQMEAQGEGVASVWV